MSWRMLLVRRIINKFSISWQILMQMTGLVKKCSCSQPRRRSVGTSNKISKKYVSIITKEPWYVFEGWISSCSYDRSWGNCKLSTADTISDPQSLTPLSPSNLLTMKRKVIMAPPGSFVRHDLYNRRQWRRMQHLADEFWSRWRKEFMSTLQARSKWTTEKRNFKINDIVLIQPDVARNSWPMGRIFKINKDENSIVRSVKLLISDKVSSVTSRILEQPISNLVLLLDAETNMWFPNKEPKVIYLEGMQLKRQCDKEM